MSYRFVYSTVAKKGNSCTSLNNIKYQTTVLRKSFYILMQITLSLVLNVRISLELENGL